MSALTVHFRDLKDILFEPGDVLVLRHADHLLDAGRAAGGKTFLNMNPFTHLAVSYQEILFYQGHFGHWKWLVALGVASGGMFSGGLLSLQSAARYVSRRKCSEAV